jgi:hypothetical protein
LHAFAQEAHTRMRNVLGGRQSLKQFADRYPPNGETEFPSEWIDNPSIANNTLKRWLKVPNNPFHTAGEDEIEVEVQEDENHGTTNGGNTPGQDEPIEQGDNPRTAPMTLRNIKKQSREMDEIKNYLKTILEQMEEIKTQNKKLKAQNERLETSNEEIKSQLEKLQAALAGGGTSGIGPSTNAPSWSNVAAIGIRTEPDRSTPSDTLTQRQNHTRAPGVDIDISGMTDPSFDTSNATEVRSRVRRAFDKHPMTKEIKWLGVDIASTELARFRVCLRTQKEADTARIHCEWLQSDFQGARMLGEQWYPIRVDKVKIHSIYNDSTARFNDDACASIGGENGITVKKIRFLRRPSPDQTHCSIVIHLASKNDAERMIDQNYMEFNGRVAYTRVFESIPTPRRCFKCHKFENHEARRCPARESTCNICAAMGHTDRECTATSPKCTNCGGPHKASDRGCPEYKRQLEMMRRTRHE